MKGKTVRTIIWIIVIIIIIAVAIIVIGRSNSATPDDHAAHEQEAPQTATTTESATTTELGVTASTSATVAATSSEAVATSKVTIANFAYSPAVTTVKAGTKVTWTNTDSVAHTVTEDSGTGPDSALIGKGETYSYTFATPGTYTYHCAPHPWMKGTVIVTP